MPEEKTGRITGLASRAIVPVVDKVVEVRYEPTVAMVEALRSRLRSATQRELADEIIRRYRKELGAVGAASGGTAAVPGAGTGVAWGSDSLTYRGPQPASPR